MRKLYLFFLVALLSGFAVEGYAQGKAPWTMTKQWITAEESESGPSIHISAMDGTLEGCDVDGITLIGTPTAMDE